MTGRPLRRAVFSCLLALCFPIPGSAEPPAADPELLSYLVRIEEVRYSWFGFSGEVRLSFTTPEGKTAECSGTLEYQRLNERVFLRCDAAPDKPAFVLKTDDERFSLYLPSHGTLYEGNIFDLEYMQEINSHIQPMDLYRSLKTMPILPENAAIESTSEENALILVTNFHRGEEYAERRLEADREGRVWKETYLTPEGEPYLEIERSGFRKIKAKSMSRVPVVLPFEIAVRNVRQNTLTKMSFDRIRTMSGESRDWRLPLPAGTKVVELPRYSGTN